MRRRNVGLASGALGVIARVNRTRGARALLLVDLGIMRSGDANGWFEPIYTNFLYHILASDNQLSIETSSTSSPEKRTDKT